MPPFLSASRVRQFVPRDGRRRNGRRRNGRREPADSISFSGLHWLAAGLFLATGAGAAVEPRSRKAGSALGSAIAGARRAPLLLAPLAGAAHGAHALRPGPQSRRATRALSWLALGAAAAELGLSVARVLTRDARPLGWRGRRRRAAWHAWIGFTSPLAFGATGLLGLLLEREERGEAARRRRLVRRAQLVERLVPKRRARVDRIVVHV